MKAVESGGGDGQVAAVAYASEKGGRGKGKQPGGGGGGRGGATVEVRESRKLENEVGAPLHRPPHLCLSVCTLHNAPFTLSL